MGWFGEMFDAHSSPGMPARVFVWHSHAWPDLRVRERMMRIGIERDSERVTVTRKDGSAATPGTDKETKHFTC